MKRRDFIKFMGAGSATIAASSALARIPEAESKIILLDKPKDIIIAKNLPNVDIVITRLASIAYTNNENIRIFETVGRNEDMHMAGSKSIDINVEYEHIGEQEVNLFRNLINPRTFTFDLKFEDPKYFHLMALNGRIFTLSQYTVMSDSNHIITVAASGIEVASQ